ncbi:MAG: HNH endonuclease [Planctomycetia bacterium]|nr:HNH endonuclease [Planctomycetia bacterium]
MPAISPQQLVDAILDAIAQSRHAGILVSALRTHPRKFAVTGPSGDDSLLWVYAWTLTFGGRTSLPHEFRIQMTTVRSPLALNPFGPTLLVGYDPDLRLLGGFDLRRHRTFTTGSPSVQIDRRVLEKALQDGLSFDRKGNDEIAVGIRPDQFMDYALTAEQLHRYGKQAATFGLLEKAASLKRIPPQEIEVLSQERQRIVQTVSRLSRNANFRQQVIDAYQNRCAVTRAQLRLVDAAHILPVGVPGSVDHVRNGIALSPTYHRAFDGGLIFLDEEYRMHTNPLRERHLQELGLAAGLESFKATLGRIHLPQDRQQWPRPEFIRKANEHRSIQVA